MATVGGGNSPRAHQAQSVREQPAWTNTEPSQYCVVTAVPGLTVGKMDQFGMELGHGEIAMDFSDETLLADKFSPRRTRSGRVYDSSTKRRRERRSSQQSPRSRNSSGQSAGSVGDSSDQEHSDEYFHLSGSYFQSNPKPPSRRLDLSELSSETKDQELPISSFLDDILSPKKFKVKDGQIYLHACLRH